LGRKIDATISIRLYVDLPGMGTCAKFETPDGLDVTGYIADSDIDDEDTAVVMLKFFTPLGDVGIDIDWEDLQRIYRDAESQIELAVLPKKEEAEADE